MFICYSSRTDLSIQSLLQKFCKFGFDWHGACQGTNIFVDLLEVCHQGSLSSIVVLWATCTSKHLLDVKDTQISTLAHVNVVNVGTLNDDCISGQVDTPC